MRLRPIRVRQETLTGFYLVAYTMRVRTYAFRLPICADCDAALRRSKGLRLLSSAIGAIAGAAIAPAMANLTQNGVPVRVMTGVMTAAGGAILGAAVGQALFRPIKWGRIIDDHLEFQNEDFREAFAAYVQSLPPAEPAIHFGECSRCQTTLKRGRPRFGPAEAECAKCSLVIQANLVPWSNLPIVTKALVAASEIIAPSRLGVFPYALILNGLLHFFYGLVYACVFSLFMSIFMPSSVEPPVALAWAGIGIGLAVLVAAALPITRLVLLIKESNEYTTTGEPPAWKAGIF